MPRGLDIIRTLPTEKLELMFHTAQGVQTQEWIREELGKRYEKRAGEVYARTAPQWNCVDYPQDGPHYVPGTDKCAWCGMTKAEMTAEWPLVEARWEARVTQ